jgi:PhnB protein
MSVIPYLTIPGGRAAEAADFYTALFGATEPMRMPSQDGKRLMHCQLDFAGGTLYLSDDFQNRTGAPAFGTVHVRLDKAADVDAVATKAKAMGSTITVGPEDAFWGDRFAMLVDPFGHTWQVGAPKG